MDFSSALMDERGYGVKFLLSVSANLSFANVRALAFGGCSLRGLRVHGHERAPSLLAGVPERPQRLWTHPQQHQTALAQRYVLPSKDAVRRRRSPDVCCMCERGPVFPQGNLWWWRR